MLLHAWGMCIVCTVLLRWEDSMAPKGHKLWDQLTLWRFLPFVGWYRSSSSKSSMLRFLARPLVLGFPCPGACTSKAFQ